MLALIKVAGLSAVFSAGLVSAFDGGIGTPARSGAKLYTERAPVSTQSPNESRHGRVLVELRAAGAEPAGRVAGRGDRLEPRTGCAGQTWPRVEDRCLEAAAATPERRNGRTIPMEHRGGDAGSVLVRVSAPATASR